jgi:hypothetical protein
MSVFEAYKEEVSRDIQTITKLISELKDTVTSKDGKSCSSLEQEIKRIIGLANVNISMMNLEAQSADDASARNSLKKIVTFQSNSLRALKSEFDRCVTFNIILIIVFLMKCNICHCDGMGSLQLSFLRRPLGDVILFR